MSEVWSQPPVGGSALLVLLALADNADEDTRQAWPSLARLSFKAQVGVSTVQRAIRELESKGIIQAHGPKWKSGPIERRITSSSGWPEPPVRLTTPVTAMTRGGSHSYDQPTTIEPSGDSPSGSEDRTFGGRRDPSESQFQRWEREYATASNKVGAMVDCYRDLFGTRQWTTRPVGSRIASIYKDYGSAVLQAMFRTLAEDPRGDPIDYVVRILQRTDKDQPEDDWPKDYVSEGSLAAQAAGLQEKPDGAAAEEDQRRETEGV